MCLGKSWLLKHDLDLEQNLAPRYASAPFGRSWKPYPSTVWGLITQRCLSHGERLRERQQSLPERSGRLAWKVC